MSDALPASDPWMDWLLHGRVADDPDYAAAVRADVDGYVDRLLDRAGLDAGATLLDVGSGEGVVAWRALGRMQGDLRVILSDVSEPLLAHAQAQASVLGWADRCRFVCTPAEDLKAIPDASVDIVTARSTLAYVADKPAAFRAFRRVLKPGGRLSLAEPVFQDEALEANLLRQHLASQPHGDQPLNLRLLHRWKAAQFPDTLEAIQRSPIANYSERDLLRMSMAEGFTDAHLQLDIRVKTSALRDWDRFLDLRPHPWAASLRSVLVEQCTPPEQRALEAMLRPAIEAGRHITLDRMAYLAVRAPAASS